MNIIEYFAKASPGLPKLVLAILLGAFCQTGQANEWVGIFREELRADISRGERVTEENSSHPRVSNPCERVWFAIIGKSKRGESLGEFYSRFSDQKRCKLSAPAIKLKLTLFDPNPKDRCSSSDIAFGGMIFIDGRLQKEADGTPRFFEGRIEDHRFRKTLPGCFPKSPGIVVNFYDSAVTELPIRLRSKSLQKSTSPYWPGKSK